jgi:hypothetical protein
MVALDWLKGRESTPSTTIEIYGADWGQLGFPVLLAGHRYWQFAWSVLLDFDSYFVRRSHAQVSIAHDLLSHVLFEVRRNKSF